MQGQSVSPNAIQLTWDPPEDSGESIEAYIVSYNDSHFRHHNRKVVKPPVNSYMLENLIPNTVYHIRVAAKSARGEGPPTTTIQVRTQEFGKTLCYPATPPQHISVVCCNSQVRLINIASLSAGNECERMSVLLLILCGL